MGSDGQTAGIVSGWAKRHRRDLVLAPASALAVAALGVAKGARGGRGEGGWPPLASSLRPGYASGSLRMKAWNSSSAMGTRCFSSG